MERKRNNQKAAVESLAEIVSLMKTLYDCNERIMDYREEYCVFAGDIVSSELNEVTKTLKSVIHALSDISEVMEEKVTLVLSGKVEFPEYRIIDIDNRMIRGETRNSFIISEPEEMNGCEGMFFVPKSLTVVGRDYSKRQFRYYENFTVSSICGGKNNGEMTNVPVQHLLRVINKCNAYYSSLDQKSEEMKQKVIEFFNECEGEWPYEQSPEECCQDPVKQSCMNDLYQVKDRDPEHLENLVYMRRRLDSNVTVEEMKICSDFFYENEFEDYTALPLINAEQETFLRQMLKEIREGNEDLLDLIEEAEAVFGPSCITAKELLPYKPFSGGQDDE